MRLLDEETPFPPRYLYRLSDLIPQDEETLSLIWPSIPGWRRQALLEDAEVLGNDDLLLSFIELGMIALGDSEASVRLPAVRILGDYESPRLLPALVNLAVNDPDPEVQAAATASLGYYVYLGEMEEIPESTKNDLESILLNLYRSSEDDQVRRRALESLGYTSREEVDELILAAYGNSNKEWVASALFAMGRSANERWIPQVSDSLDSRWPAVRCEAARAAGELNMRDAVPRLLELLDDPDENVLTATLWSLSELGGGGVREALTAMYDQTEDAEMLEYLDAAIDNLSFNEGLGAFELFDLPENGNGSEDEYEYENDGYEDEDDHLDEIEDLEND